jgi:alpha-aminoadipate carrier protein LysW
MPTAICPECSEEVYVDADAEQGDVINCDECGSDLVLVGLDPLELDLHEPTAEDGDGDDDFDDFDYDDDRY